ncbi:MAG: serine hydrolase, partial [Pseudomonadota bacterium]
HLSACQSDRSDSYPHEAEEIGSVYDVYNASLMPDLQVNTFRNTDRLFATRTVKRGPNVYDLPYTDDVIVGVNIAVDGQDFDFFDYVSLNRVAGLLVIKEGEIVHESYHLGNTEETRWMSMSVAKSITATLAGAALQDGYIDSLDDTVGQYIPVLRDSAYEKVSVRQLLQMTSGVGWVEPYADPDSNRKVLLEAQIAQLPGGMIEVMKALPRVAEPGQVWNYSTGETQVLGELLVSATGMTLADYLSEKIWASFGMESDAEWWLDSPNGVEIGGSGLSATLRDYGRFGQFLLDEGMVKGERVLPAGWIEESTREQIIGNDPIPYGYMVWPVPIQAGEAHRTAYEAKGLYGQLIYVNPKESLVIVVLRAWPVSWLMNPLISDYQFFDMVIETLR